jgi:hypothetical protein
MGNMKYVSKFSFPSHMGFTGSAGAAPVRGYMRGGAVKSEPKGEFKKGGWIAGATKNKGALHRALPVPEGKKIPAAKLEKAEHSKNPTMRKRAALAETLKGMHHKKGGKVAKHAAGGLATKAEYEVPREPMEKYARGGKVAKYAVGGVVSKAEYEVPRTASPIYKYAKGGRVATAGPKSPTKMDGYPKVAGKYVVPPTEFKNYARGGMAKGDGNDSNGKWADYKKGGMKRRASGGRC